MDTNKKIARMVGVLFIIGTAAGILSHYCSTYSKCSRLPD